MMLLRSQKITDVEKTDVTGLQPRLLNLVRRVALVCTVDELIQREIPTLVVTIDRGKGRVILTVDRRA